MKKIGRRFFWLPLFVLGVCSASSNAGELITNTGFDSGSTGWVLSGNFYADSRFSNYRSCCGYAYFSNSDGTPGNNLIGSMYQSLTIPANAISASLSFWYNITTQETGSTANDVLNVTIKDGAGNYKDTVELFSNLNNWTFAKLI